jgi:fluoroacetyl-CoA thioesterase
MARRRTGGTRCLTTSATAVPELKPGLIGEVRRVVDASMLASAIGSGSLDVFATPALVALMELAACAALEDHLDADQTSVGVRLDVAHLAATPPGVAVRARAELVEVDGRRLVFRVEAFDSQDRIGEGTHERALVDPQRLLARANAKLNPR